MNDIASKESIPSHVVERDYVQCLYLREINEKSDRFIFKGGTALRLIHGLDRYSEDLDFNHPDEREKIIETAETCAENINKYGIQAEIKDLRWGTTGLSLSLSFRGPLFKEESLSSKGKIRIDISTREEEYDSELSLVKVDYPDIDDFWVQALTLEELAAEKVRALRTRAKPRDLFDIWHLHKHGHIPDEKKIKKKMCLYPEGETLDDPLSEVKKNWESDLSVLLRQTPPLDKVIEDLSELLDTF